MVLLAEHLAESQQMIFLFGSAEQRLTYLSETPRTNFPMRSLKAFADYVMNSTNCFSYTSSATCYRTFLRYSLRSCRAIGRASQIDLGYTLTASSSPSIWARYSLIRKQFCAVLPISEARICSRAWLVRSDSLRQAFKNLQWQAMISSRLLALANSWVRRIQFISITSSERQQMKDLMKCMMRLLVMYATLKHYTLDQEVFCNFTQQRLSCLSRNLNQKTCRNKHWYFAIALLFRIRERGKEHRKSRVTKSTYLASFLRKGFQEKLKPNAYDYRVFIRWICQKTVEFQSLRVMSSLYGSLAAELVLTLSSNRFCNFQRENCLRVSVLSFLGRARSSSAASRKCKKRSPQLRKKQPLREVSTSYSLHSVNISCFSCVFAHQYAFWMGSVKPTLVPCSPTNSPEKGQTASLLQARRILMNFPVTRIVLASLSRTEGTISCLRRNLSSQLFHCPPRYSCQIINSACRSSSLPSQIHPASILRQSLVNLPQRCLQMKRTCLSVVWVSNACRQVSSCPPLFPLAASTSSPSALRTFIAS